MRRAIQNCASEVVGVMAMLRSQLVENIVDPAAFIDLPF
jgi:hypothetical protein